MSVWKYIIKTHHQTAMIFCTYAIVFTVFPSMIAYDHLPFMD